ncbi:hypothetical protein [Thiobacillus sp.]|uniref:c-type cytochrome n=1 Tax=Thiobacillus sp. TaxID=924 RepID=UPI0025CD331D|nr:hypothetical protein [Thiobacillus sp.]
MNNDPKKAPVKTVESYWPYATTLFDYIKRAMPFYTPGSLTNDEVYSVTGYILSEANILKGDEPITAESLAKSPCRIATDSSRITGQIILNRQTSIRACASRVLHTVSTSDGISEKV